MQDSTSEANLMQIEIGQNIAIIAGIEPDKHDKNTEAVYEEILTYIGFSGKEKRCWYCKRERQVIIKTDFYGNLIQYQEVCNNS